MMAKEMEADRQRGLQAEAYRDYLRVQDGKSMRAALDVQMEEKEAMKAEAYQAFLKEKEMVDKVCARPRRWRWGELPRTSSRLWRLPEPPMRFAALLLCPYLLGRPALPSCGRWSRPFWKRTTRSGWRGITRRRRSRAT